MQMQQMTICYFSYFCQKIGFDISCRLFPQEAICIEYQGPLSGKKIEKSSKLSSSETCIKYLSLLLGKSHKNVSNCHLLKLGNMLIALRVIRVREISPGKITLTWKSLPSFSLGKLLNERICPLSGSKLFPLRVVPIS